MPAAAQQRAPSFWARYEAEATPPSPAPSPAASVGSPVLDLWARLEREYLQSVQAAPTLPAEA